ncbi:transcription factor IIIC subunit delta N-term-domain-containing protein [Mucor mucedo]|uniref:transcription factor IIIC subunit delta N-term-domain-containing protein n=1 Tax=Mucor mucedo TaxID=29922 RepID=UPI00221FBD6E|nr:transcription factor IIIC subunit delta N-term-domain-containing protein [Mucor mucedo]KAI7888552.1 transcription factor IIIC subunit delta N-term-domain-containing protein [Mucor mucedo]
MEKLTPLSLKNRPYFIDCVQWSEDCQLAICLDMNVHIITPILIGLSSNEESVKHVGFTLPELKLTSSAPIDDCNNIQTSFLLEEGYRCANWSPSGLSQTNGCFLVVVTTKHRALIYQCSAKDPINSDWQLYADLTESVNANAITHDHPTKGDPHHTLYAAWSKKIVADPFSTSPCLLALSNKAGDLCLYKLGHDGIEYSTTITAHTSYVNLVHWSNWQKKTEGKYTAYVASASTNGTAALTAVTVQIETDEENHTTIKDIQYSILRQWFDEGSSVPTLLKVHDDFENDSPFIRIALSKGITIRFTSLLVDEAVMDVDKEWEMHVLEHSALGLSGGNWINDFDFRCYTVEGEGLQFHLSAEDELTVDEVAHKEISSKLIQKYKQQWMDEQEKADEDDIVGASDALPYLFGGADSLGHIYTAIYFAMRPTVDVHYRPESTEDTNLAFILQKPRGLLTENLLTDVDTYVTDPNFFFVKPVRGLLREVLDYLIEDDDATHIDRWLSKLKEYMAVKPVLDGRDLTKAIYCESSTIASRIIFNADLELKKYKMVLFKTEFLQSCVEAKQNTLSHFLAHVFDYVSRLPDTEFSKFSEQDQMVMLLLCDFGLTISNSDLTAQCLEMYVRLQDNFDQLGLYQEIAYSSSPYGPYNPKPREKCPVCDELVRAIGDSTLAQCDAGHFWDVFIAVEVY